MSQTITCNHEVIVLHVSKPSFLTRCLATLCEVLKLGQNHSTSNTFTLLVVFSVNLGPWLLMSCANRSFQETILVACSKACWLVLSCNNIKTLVNDRKVLWIHADHQYHFLKHLFSVEHAELRAQLFCTSGMKPTLLLL